METWNLQTKLSKVSKLSKDHALALQRLQLETIEDLLNHLPTHYADERATSTVAELKNGEKVTLYGQLNNLQTRRTFKTKIPMSEATFSDLTGSLKLVWFHQAYIAKMYQEGDFVKISGLVQEKAGKFSIFNPDIERVSPDHIFQENSMLAEVKDKKALVELIPIYRETKNLTSNFLRSLLKKVLAHPEIITELKAVEPLSKNILQTLHLPDLPESYLSLHLPRASTFTKAKNKVEVARKRFAFQEIFLIQVLKQLERARAKESLAYEIQTETGAKFIKSLETKYKFKLTSAQKKVIKEIADDLERVEPMSRLLEGDVGSGKTLVAQVATYLATQNFDEEGRRLQVAIMAPTEILARQHFQAFIDFFREEYLEIGLLTSKVCQKYPSKLKPGEPTQISKAQLKKWVAEGRISIVIGTHSLIQKNIEFQNLALVIIDEQHRFGVRQRRELANKKSSTKKVLAANDIKNLTNKKQVLVEKKQKLPHLLSMSATPIPRTLALTIFGDLDLSIIDELPVGRKPIETKLVKEHDREKIYQEILKEIKTGSQVYVVVPRISELDEEELQSGKKLNLRSVASEVQNLEKFLMEQGEKNIRVVGLHSKIKKEEKEEIMQQFLENQVQILVSTSVIEVGINVPNATRMIIEGAERFGLAQLHQLRGRIGRGTKESICYLFSDSENEKTSERLKSLILAKNGFELAEYDLNQRGIGSLISKKQWGASDLAMEAIKNVKLVEVARTQAQNLIVSDPNLEKFSQLKKIITEKEKVHLE